MWIVVLKYEPLYFDFLNPSRCEIGFNQRIYNMLFDPSRSCFKILDLRYLVLVRRPEKLRTKIRN